MKVDHVDPLIFCFKVGTFPFYKIHLTEKKSSLPVLVLKKKKFLVVFYTTLFRVINTNIMLAYSCFVVMLLISSILKLAELLGI